MWKFARLLFKYCLPVLLLIASVSTVWDLLDRWEVARQGLSRFPTQTAFLVGAGYEFKGDVTERHADYQLLPTSTEPPRLVRISLHSKRGVEVTVLETGYVRFVLGWIATLAALAVCGFLWWRDVEANRPRGIDR